MPGQIQGSPQPKQGKVCPIDPNITSQRKSKLLPGLVSVEEHVLAREPNQPQNPISVDENLQNILLLLYTHCHHGEIEQKCLHARIPPQPGGNF